MIGMLCATLILLQIFASFICYAFGIESWSFTSFGVHALAYLLGLVCFVVIALIHDNDKTSRMNNHSLSAGNRNE